jgi:hypothetical protein
MVIPAPMPLVLQEEPFDDPNWIFEIKHHGFRTLAAIELGQWSGQFWMATSSQASGSVTRTG